MKIITLTLNPAFDMHCYVDKFQPFHENIADITSFEAGGKGVNISRALTCNGVENIAVIIVGKENSTEYVKQLQKDGVNYKTVEVDGRIRENLTLHSGDGADETRISFKGFKCDNSVLDRVKKIVGEVDGKTVITFTGSVPDGVALTDVKNFIKSLTECGAKVVIDSRSFTLNDVADCGAWLVKPNKDETKFYTGIAINCVADGISAAKKIRGLGIENVIISLGKDGAVYACADGVFVASTPQIDAKSTIGAGDSMIAGFISKEDGAEGRLKQAVAFGTAACMRQGTRPPEPADVKVIKSKVSATKVE